MKAQAVFEEPYRTQFVDLIRSGVSVRDIHLADAPVDDTSRGGAHNKEAFVSREVTRVDNHLDNICQEIASLRPRRVLDAGCGTAALSVALALTYPDARVDAFDADPSSVKAGALRLQGYGVADRVTLRAVQPNAPLPYEPASFDLVTCTSVIEFITRTADRQRFLQQLGDVLAPGGHLVLTTPNPWYVREQHSRRLFQHVLKNPAFPWAPTGHWIGDSLGPRFARVAQPGRVQRKLGRHLPLALPDWLSGMLAHALPWQFLVFRKR